MKMVRGRALRSEILSWRLVVLSRGGQRTAASQASDAPEEPFFPALARAPGSTLVSSVQRVLMICET